MQNFKQFLDKEPRTERVLGESQDKEMDSLLNELRDILEEGYDEMSIKMMDWSEVSTRDIGNIKKAARILIQSLEF